MLFVGYGRQVFNKVMSEFGERNVMLTGVKHMVPFYEKEGGFQPKSVHSMTVYWIVTFWFILCASGVQYLIHPLVSRQ